MKYHEPYPDMIHDAVKKYCHSYKQSFVEMVNTHVNKRILT